MTFWLALTLCAICFFFVGYRFGIRDREADELDQIQRLAKERDYWHGVAARNKMEMIRLGADNLKPSGPPEIK